MHITNGIHLLESYIYLYVDDGKLIIHYMHITNIINQEKNYIYMYATNKITNDNSTSILCNVIFWENYTIQKL